MGLKFGLRGECGLADETAKGGWGGGVEVLEAHVYLPFHFGSRKGEVGVVIINMLHTGIFRINKELSHKMFITLGPERILIKIQFLKC